MIRDRSKPSPWCPHGFLKIPGAGVAAGCPRCIPRPIKVPDSSRPPRLSELSLTIREVACVRCHLRLRRTAFGTWKAVPGQKRVVSCEKRCHSWQPAANGERQGVRVCGADADSELRQDENRVVGGDVDNGGDGQ